MTDSSIGVAVIGAGMAGRAHAAGYRSASTLYGEGLPEIRLVAIADVNPAFATDTARRFGFERAEAGWEAVAAADDVDVVSVVVANPLHRQIVEGLLAAGKHVLCEKPMAPTVEDAEAMVAAAKASGRETGIGFVFRRSPAIGAIREQLASGAIGRPLHFNGHYWCDYGVDPRGPMSWRYKGGPGSGALSDIGSHLIDLAEFVCGPIQSVRGAVLSTFVTERALPAGRGRRPRRRRGQRRDRAGGERGPGHLHGHLRLRRHRHPVGLPGRLRPGQLPRLRAVHLRRARPPSTWPGPASSASSTAPRPARPRASARCWSGPPTRTSPAASRWTSPASATARTTCSPSRPGPSSSRSPGWRGSRGWPRSSRRAAQHPPAGRGRRLGQGRRRRRGHRLTERTVT